MVFGYLFWQMDQSMRLFDVRNWLCEIYQYYRYVNESISIAPDTSEIRRFRMKIKYCFLLLITVLISMLFTVFVSAYVIDPIWGHGLYTIPSQMHMASHSTTNQRNRFQEALDIWNDACFSYDFLTYGGLIPMESEYVQDGYNSVTILPDPEEDTNAYTYHTVDYRVGSMYYIVECEINFNSNRPWYAGTGTCPSTSQDFLTVAIHEIGHVFGLGEFTNRFYNGIREPMYQNQEPGEMVRYVTQDDILGIHAIYLD